MQLREAWLSPCANGMYLIISFINRRRNVELDIFHWRSQPYILAMRFTFIKQMTPINDLNNRRSGWDLWEGKGKWEETG